MSSRPASDAATTLCLARWEAGRSYPCSKPKGHDGPHVHPMDPVPKDYFLAVSA